MKKLALAMAAIIIGLSFTSGVSFAEEKADESIFKYKKELSITDKQEKNLKEILAKLQSFLANKQNELNVARAELGKMITERADLDKIKAKLNDVARIQAEASYEDIASTRAIETELNGTQLSKWRSMQAEFVKNLQSAADAKELKK